MGTATGKKSECGPAHSMEQYVDVICYFSFGLSSYI
jgi:hypothetical protein